jgi:hypothetical protein
MSGTEVQHARQLQVTSEPELTEIANPSVQAIKSFVETDTDDASNDRDVEAHTVSPDRSEVAVTAAQDQEVRSRDKDDSLDREDVLSEHKVLLIQKDQAGGSASTAGARITSEITSDGWVLISLARPPAESVHARPPAEKQAPSQASAKKVLKDDKKEAKASKTLETTTASATSETDKPKTKKTRTVQFAEGTTLPIVDITPKTTKPSTSGTGTGKSPMQCLTDTMQVIKRYETDLRAQETTSQRFEQKRLMLTIEKMFTVVVLVQGGITLALLAVLLAMAMKT